MIDWLKVSPTCSYSFHPWLSLPAHPWYKLRTGYLTRWPEAWTRDRPNPCLRLPTAVHFPTINFEMIYACNLSIFCIKWPAMDQQLAGHLSYTPPEDRNIFQQKFSMHDAITDIAVIIIKTSWGINDKIQSFTDQNTKISKTQPNLPSPCHKQCVMTWTINHLTIARPLHCEVARQSTFEYAYTVNQNGSQSDGCISGSLSVSSLCTSQSSN